MKRIVIIFLCLLCLSACNKQTNVEEANTIVFDGQTATFNGEKIKDYDYVWHISPENKEEYYTGTKPNDDDLYIAHDIVYYPELPKDSFTLQEYDGEKQWLSYYTNEELKDYIFSTLPNLGEDLPIEMMHSEKEAYDNPVLHIRKAGEYILKGNFNGQVLIDLKEDAYNDKNGKVTLILDGVNINCSVGPAIIFYNVYEVDNTWEEKESYDNNIDLKDAGAKVVIKDGTENNITGSNVYRLLKPEYKNKENTVQKKQYKMDGAFYSFMSLLIKGEDKGTGILNITSTTFEGLNSELHLQIDSGYINIVSIDDGINVNEDHVSVFKMNGGRLVIFAGQGKEGDVIDSNGYIVVNGGTILGTSPSLSDDILDSEDGTEVSSNATIISSGSARFNFNEGNRPEPPMDNFDPNNLSETPLAPPNFEKPPEKFEETKK